MGLGGEEGAGLLDLLPPPLTPHQHHHRQVPNADFFTKMVPLLDGGQDVGMVLSPQVGGVGGWGHTGAGQAGPCPAGGTVHRGSAARAPPPTFP